MAPLCTTASRRNRFRGPLNSSLETRGRGEGGPSVRKPLTDGNDISKLLKRRFLKNDDLMALQMCFDSCRKAPKSSAYDYHLDTRRRVVRNGRSHSVFPTPNYFCFCIFTCLISCSEAVSERARQAGSSVTVTLQLLMEMRCSWSCRLVAMLYGSRDS